MKDVFLSLDELLTTVTKLGISYKTESADADLANPQLYRFKSLRSIEAYGIYYFTGGNNLPLGIENSIVLVDAEVPQRDSVTTIKVENAQLTFYKLMNEFYTLKSQRSGVHETAVIIGDCEIDPTAYIGPFCVLEDCKIGASTILHSHVTVFPETIIDEGTQIESHSSIGASGVAWIWDPVSKERIRQPQIGYTYIGKSVFLGSDISIVRGSVNEVTSVEDGCVIAHGSKIGHGSVVGKETHFANNVTIAGNVSIGEKSFIGAGAVIRPQIKIAPNTVIGAGAVIVKNIVEKGAVFAGNPAKQLIKNTDKLSGVPQQLEEK